MEQLFLNSCSPVTKSVKLISFTNFVYDFGLRIDIKEEENCKCLAVDRKRKIRICMNEKSQI